MRSFKIIGISLLAIVQTSLNFSYGQSPVGIGQWRVHYNFGDLKNAVEVDTKIYCANNTSLFFYDQEDKSLNLISKKDGLSGIDISKLGAYKKEELLIGYADGNIDFIKGDAITRFDAIQRASITGSKKINQFYERGNKIFICTDYGLSVLDMSRRELSDSYLNISNDGSSNIFYATVLSQDADSIFVASEKGLLVAQYSPGVNLRNYANWKLVTLLDGLPTGAVKSVGRSGSTIFAGVNTKGVYYFNGMQWQATTITGNEIRNITSADGAAVTCVDDKIYKLTSATGSQLFYTSYLYSPYSGFITADGAICFSQSNYGICFYRPSLDQIGAPVGPLFKDTFRLKYLDETIINCRGGLSVSYGNVYLESSAMLLGKDDQWKGYTIYDGFPLDSRDLLDVAIHTASKRWYFSSFGFGLIKFNPADKSYVVLDSTNSPLKMKYLTGLATDKEGMVWVCTHAVVDRSANKPFLHAIAPDVTGNTWYSFKALQSDGKYPVEIVIDQQSNKWMRMAAAGGIRGLMMFKEINKAAGTSTQIYFGVEQNRGELPDINVNAISVDQTGQVWIGTGKGICVFTNPSQIKSGSIPKAYLPIVKGFPLFFDKKINCIKTDAANRKWVGTPDGVFLLSADGLETILKFDKSNSPMIDNNVNTITINERSGEVFFGSDKGIISYRGDATFGEVSHQDVKIFPNPVERDFEGVVGISGLANNARVKITDVAGKLTYETPSNGGTASWNLKDYTGRRATAGVYLIFSASEDGAEKYVGKIAVLD
jgi:ligand-binding sensor domain-containing protein